MDASFQSHFNGLSTVQIQMVQPSIPKSYKRSKMIETHFYHLYSTMTGSKIIAGSPSKVWHLILQLLSVFFLPICCHIGSGMPYLSIFVDEVVPLLGGNG